MRCRIMSAMNSTSIFAFTELAECTRAVLAPKNVLSARNSFRRRLGRNRADTLPERSFVGRNDAEVAAAFQLFLYSLRLFQSRHETSFVVIEEIEES